jgi:hypothetical protein
MYLGILGLSPKVDKALFKDLKSAIEKQIELASGLSELSG